MRVVFDFDLTTEPSVNFINGKFSHSAGSDLGAVLNFVESVT
jgi:hypothetical protein